MGQDLQGKGASDSQSRAGEGRAQAHASLREVPPAPAHEVSETLGSEMLLEF